MKKSIFLQIVMIIVVLAVSIGCSKHGNRTEPAKNDQTKKPPVNIQTNHTGGVNVVLKCKPSIGTENDPMHKKELASKIEDVMNILRKRIDPNGDRNAVIQKQDDLLIDISIPGENDLEGVKKLLCATGLLQFVHIGKKDMKKGDRVAEEILKRPCPTDRLYGNEESDYCVVLTGAMMKKASSDYQNDAPIVDFELTKQGGDILFRHSMDHLKQNLAIVIDGSVLSVPILMGAIHDKGIIEGQFTNEEVRELVAWLNSGALPMNVEIVDARIAPPKL